MAYNDRMLVSYLNLRKAIGMLGILLSALLPAGLLLASRFDYVQKSLSYYYWTTSRDVLVGVLAIAGALLLTYRGYDRKDRALSMTAGIAALAVAIFPCFNESGRVGYFQAPAKASEVIHLVAACVFFLSLAYMSFFQFSKGSVQKKILGVSCNLIYRICGASMLALMIILAAIVLSVPSAVVEEHAIIYMIESMMLVAFGSSWLVKGYASPSV